MTKLEAVEQAASDLSPAEKAALLQSVARELGDATPGVGPLFDGWTDARQATLE